jgi:hypothetical protein
MMLEFLVLLLHQGLLFCPHEELALPASGPGASPEYLLVVLLGLADEE